jgi:hypothetical protein
MTEKELFFLGFCFPQDFGEWRFQCPRKGVADNQGRIADSLFDVLNGGTAHPRHFGQLVLRNPLPDAGFSQNRDDAPGIVLGIL